MLFSMMFTKIYPSHFLLITISEKKSEAKWTHTLRVTLILAYVYFCGGKRHQRTFRASMWSHCSNVHMHKEELFCTSFLEVQASLVAQMVKNPPAMQETWVQPLGWEDTLEKGKAAHSSVLACPWGCKESDTTEPLSLSCGVTVFHLKSICCCCC